MVYNFRWIEYRFVPTFYASTMTIWKFVLYLWDFEIKLLGNDEPFALFFNFGVACSTLQLYLYEVESLVE